ncbi:MAG: VWA domain-containing protein [Prevotella sp.]|nr:VWA domain-containing protein [Prevotella sp.]
MKKVYVKSFAAIICIFALSSCTLTWDNPIGDKNKIITVPGIPSDEVAELPPVVNEPNIIIPGLNYTVETVNGVYVLHFNMNGIQDPNNPGQWIRLFGTANSAQNLWLTLDETSKGVTVVNTIDETSNQLPMVDLVFLVDNSGSMSQESDVVARDIKEWADNLTKTLDIRFGCVGYDGAINGAIDITSVSELRTYLDRSTGTSRTKGFVGDNSAALENVKGTYVTGGNSRNECGVAALRFAKDNFTFRPGSNKVYVNFTDEYNQPNGNQDFSTEWVQNEWTATDGTIHTVYSNGPDNILRYYSEEPWLISDYTGGTTIKTNSSFTGVTLNDLPVTGALQNTYVISFTNIENLFDGNPHTVTITIYAPNGSIQGKKEFQIVFDKNQNGN